MNVTLIAHTVLNVEALAERTGWRPESHSPGTGDDLAEAAGRACYQSWKRPNPKTASNEDYLAHILDVQHYSVLEHSSLSFYVEGVSRSLTHELVRHRHLSYSQLSQRYVDMSDAAYVVPPDAEGTGEGLVEALLENEWQHQQGVYERITDAVMQELRARGVSGTSLRKRARQAARAVLGNMSETKLVVSGNARAWRYFVELRGTEGADLEISEFACRVLEECQQALPNSFQDLQVTEDRLVKRNE